MHLYKLKIDIETDLRRCVFPFLILFAFGGLHSHFVWCKRGSITYRHDIIHFDADDFGEFRDGLFLYLKFLLFCERLCEDVVAGVRHDKALSDRMYRVVFLKASYFESIVIFILEDGIHARKNKSIQK